MALIRPLTVSTIASRRKKEELYGFRQTVLACKNAKFAYLLPVDAYITFYLYQSVRIAMSSTSLHSASQFVNSCETWS